MKKSIAGYLASASLAVAAAVSTPAEAQTAASPAAAAPARPASGATPAQRMFGDINPKLAELTDGVLFGDVWARPGLTQRDRSLITVAALIAMNRPDQLRSHSRAPVTTG